MKKWLTARPPATSIEAFQDLVDGFVDVYNQRRVHTSIGKVTPAVAYTRLPKDIPNNSGAEIHHRIRHDRIDNLNIRVINKQTGNLIRALKLDPTRDYQPRFKT